MIEPRNRVVRVSRFGDPEGLEVVDAPLPTAGPAELRVRSGAICTHRRCASGRRS
jgi:NADPH:quinone reductase